MTDAPEPIPPPTAQNRPDFEIQVEDGRGLLLLRPRTFFGWLRVERLELQIPHVSFPLDITGGMAQFRAQTCRVGRALLSIEAGALDELVARRAEALAAAGFGDVRLRIAGGGAAEVSGRARVGERSADFAAAIEARSDGRTLVLSATGARTFGYLRRPAPLVAHELLCALTGAAHDESGDPDRAAPKVSALAEVRMRPLDLFIERVLAPAGWQLPDVSAVRLVGVGLHRDGVELRFAAADDTPTADEPPPWQAGDEALRRHDFPGALAAYRQALAAEPDETTLHARLLAVLCARDGTLREAEVAAVDTLGRWPDFVPAHLARAAAALGRGRDDEAAEHFARVADAAAERDDETAVRAALAAARSASDPARAAAYYERVLSRRADDAEASAALVDLYAAAGRWPALSRLLRARAASPAAAAEPRRAAAARVALAEVLFARLNDHAAAAAELEQATQLDEENRRAWDLLARVRAESGELVAAVAALDRLDRLPAPGESGDEALGRARTLVRIAARAEEAGDDAQARTLYGRALDLAPDEPGVLEKVAALAERYGDRARAIAAYPRLIAACPNDPWRRRRAEREFLRLLVESGDLARARRCLAESSGDPDPESLVGLAALEWTCGQAQAALDALGRAAPLAVGARAAAIELQRARWSAELGRGDQQRAALERAFALAPDSDDGHEAARLAAAAAREAGDREAETRWLDALADEDGAPALRRAQLYFEAGDAERAFHLADRLRATLPEARRLYADAVGALGDPAGRARELESLAKDTADPAAERALLADAARSHLAAEDLPLALAAARRADLPGDGDPAVRALLAEIAWRSRAWDEVAELYRALLPSAQGGVRAEYARRLGAAFAALDRPHEALSAWRIVVETADAEGDALAESWQRLGAELERAGDAAGAADAFRALAAHPRTGESPPARAAHYRHAAALLQKNRADAARAAGLLDEALQLDPESPETLDALVAAYAALGDARGLARARDQRRAQQRAVHTRTVEAAPNDLEALRFLAPDALESGDPAAAERFYARLADRAAGADTGERRAALLALARLTRDAGRDADAENFFWTAVEVTPRAEQHDLLVEIEDLYRRGARWPDLAVVLTHHATLVDDPALRGELETRRIRVLLDDMHNPGAALEACEAALARAPGDRLLRALADQAVAALEASVASERPAAQTLADLFLPELKEARTLRGAGDILRGLLARIAELHHSDRALDRAGSQLLQELQATAEAAGHWAPLADGLEAVARVAPDAETAASWLRAAAELRRTHLHDRAGAAAALERALGYRPDDSAIVAELEPLLRALGRPDRLAAAYQRHLDALGPARRAPALIKLGRLWADELNDDARAEACFDEARKSEPPAAIAAQQVKRGALGRAVGVAPLPPEAAAALVALHEKIAVIPVENRGAINAVELELGELYLRSGDRVRARAQVARVLAEEPANGGALATLIDLASDEGSWTEAAEALVKLSHLREDPQARAELLYRAGEIWRGRLGDEERAAERYLQACDLDPRHAPTLRRLLDYFFRAGDRDTLLEIAAELDATGALLAEETGAITQARAAVAAALADDAPLASRIAGALGEPGAAAIADALAHADWAPPSACAEAARLLARPPGPPLPRLRGELVRLGAADPRAASVAALL